MSKSDQNTQKIVREWVQWSGTGGGVAVAVCCTWLAGVAWAVSLGVITEGIVTQFTLLGGFVACFVGMSAVVKKTRKYVILTAVVVTAVYMLGMYGVNSFVFQNGWSGMKIDVQVMGALMGSLAASLFVRTTKKKRRKLSSK